MLNFVKNDENRMYVRFLLPLRDGYGILRPEHEAGNSVRCQRERIAGGFSWRSIGAVG